MKKCLLGVLLLASILAGTCLLKTAHDAIVWKQLVDNFEPLPAVQHPDEGAFSAE